MPKKAGCRREATDRRAIWQCASSSLPPLLGQQESCQGAKLFVSQVPERRHEGAFRIGGRIVEMADQPFRAAAARPFQREVRPDLASLAVQLVTHEAAFLAVEGFAVRHQLILRLPADSRLLRL